MSGLVLRCSSLVLVYYVQPWISTNKSSDCDGNIELLHGVHAVLSMFLQ
jgi:hypothetical protein